MGLFSTINISGTGLTAERLRMDVIANNIANAETTRTPDGGPYRRQRVIFTPRKEKFIYDLPFVTGSHSETPGRGVRVKEIENDLAPGPMKYEPTHPDADEKGYVHMPNVNIITEMVDMISAQRAYEANVTVVKSAKSMFMKALDISR